MTPKWIAVLSTIWLTAVVSFVLLVAKINHQRYEERPARELAAERVFSTPPADETAADTEESAAAMVMPSVTIVAPERGATGVTQMQGTGRDTGARPDDLLIGPGIVTHPVAIPPATVLPPEP
jgi:hypothetical protein